jgi:tRNA(fMet)-specific endonuclease VapC
LISIIHARDGTDTVLDKLIEHDGAVLLSTLSLAELQRGIYRYPADTVVRRMRLEILLKQIPVLPFDAAAARPMGASSPNAVGCAAGTLTE